MWNSDRVNEISICAAISLEKSRWIEDYIKHQTARQNRTVERAVWEIRVVIVREF